MHAADGAGAPVDPEFETMPCKVEHNDTFLRRRDVALRPFERDPLTGFVPCRLYHQFIGSAGFTRPSRQS